MGGKSQVYAEIDSVIEINVNVEVGEAVGSPLIDGLTVRNGTPVGTSHLT